MSNNKDKFLLSFSATETFNTCQRKYYYNYVAKLPKKDWPWLTFGNFNHLVLEKFHNYIIFLKKRKHQYDKKALLKRAFLSALRKTARVANAGKAVMLTQDQIDASKALLQKYYKRIDANEPNVHSTEKYFEIDLGDNIILRGYIDRIDMIDKNTYKITDYKTSKAAFKINKTAQLAIYAIGFRKTLDAEDVEIYKQLDFLKVGKTEPANEEGERHDPSTDAALLASLLKTGQEIRAKIANDKLETDWQYKENDFCWCCDFKNRCIASRGQQSPSSDFEFA
jgi:putative RecB family exonuclease